MPAEGVWYFAYGSNLSVDLMKERVGEWRLSKRALVRNYRLTFNVFSKKWQGYTANLRPSERFEDVVRGVVYHLTKEQLAKLQTHEGVAPVEVRVELEDGNEISHARAFLWPVSDPGRDPPVKYRKAMEQGFADHGYTKSQADKTFAGAKATNP